MANCSSLALISMRDFLGAAKEVPVGMNTLKHVNIHNWTTFPPETPIRNKNTQTQFITPPKPPIRNTDMQYAIRNPSQSSPIRNTDTQYAIRIPSQTSNTQYRYAIRNTHPLPNLQYAIQIRATSLIHGQHLESLSDAMAPVAQALAKAVTVTMVHEHRQSGCHRG